MKGNGDADKFRGFNESKALEEARDGGLACEDFKLFAE